MPATACPSASSFWACRSANPNCSAWPTTTSRPPAGVTRRPAPRACNWRPPEAPARKGNLIRPDGVDSQPLRESTPSVLCSPAQRDPVTPHVGEGEPARATVDVQAAHRPHQQRCAGRHAEHVVVTAQAGDRLDGELRPAGRYAVYLLEELRSGQRVVVGDGEILEYPLRVGLQREVRRADADGLAAQVQNLLDGHHGRPGWQLQA